MSMLRKLVTAAMLILLTAGCGAGARALSAAEQVPRLGVALERVDGALAAHKFSEARLRLRELKADVVDARDTGQLNDADAQRALDAIAKLMKMLPAPSTSAVTP